MVSILGTSVIVSGCLGDGGATEGPLDPAALASTHLSQVVSEWLLSDGPVGDLHPAGDEDVHGARGEAAKGYLLLSEAHSMSCQHLGFLLRRLSDYSRDVVVVARESEHAAIRDLLKRERAEAPIVTFPDNVLDDRVTTRELLMVLSDEDRVAGVMRFEDGASAHRWLEGA